MSLFKQILLEMSLINGSSEINDINDAINNFLSVKISYNEEGADGERVICPVAYGLSTKGSPVVRAFQRSGPSKSGHKPNWRLFKVENIKYWENLENEKYEPKSLVGFNADGDKQMSIIYTIAKIGSAKQIELCKQQGMPTGLKSTPVYKKDVLNIAKKQEENPVDNEHYTAENAIDDIIKNAAPGSFSEKLDNGQSDNYINVNNKINAPETNPITKSQIPGGDNKNEGERIVQKSTVSNDPIMKKDLEIKDDVEDDEIKNIKSTFNNFMNRMDKTNNEEDADF